MRNLPSYTALCAACLIPAILSCTRREPDEGRDAVRIVFNSPVVGNPVKGTGILDGTTYTDAQGDFIVWGYVANAPGINPASAGSNGIEYIAGATCKHESSYWIPYYEYKDADNVTQTGYYYWRSTAGYMTFQALSPASAFSTDPAVRASLHDWSTGMQLSAYSVETSPGAQSDVLFSDYTMPSQRGDYTGTPYGVDLKFNHALAAVKFRFREYQDYADGGASPIVITKVEVLNAYRTGNFAENRTPAALNSYTAAPAWTGQNTETDFTVFNKPAAEGITLTWGTSEAVITEPVGAPLLIIPQDLDHTADGLGKVSVRVTFTQDGGSSTTTVSASLPGLRGTHSGSPIVVNDWAIGKRYTYVVTIGLNKIIFDPTVEDWVWDPTEDIFVMIG